MSEITLASAPFAIALLCAALMGYAIQRGATCMVAAVEQAVSERRFHRLNAMLEAGLWVAIGLLVARALGHLTMAPAHYRIGIATFAGGALLGLGALINRSCVFGSIAKLGSGKWAYMLTPPGFFLGCVLAGHWFAPPRAIAGAPPLFGAGPLIALPLVVYALWRGRSALIAVRTGGALAKVWAPHQATMVIGLAFVVMLLTVGNWAYTQVLADVAHGMVSGLVFKSVLFGALLAGAIGGGWTAGLIHPTMPTAAELVRCLIGGGLMGAGSVAIPGSNDGLILLGLPLILPYAWVALASMVLAIGVGMLIERHWSSH